MLIDLPSSCAEEFSFEELESILKVATDLKFDLIRALAIKAITDRMSYTYISPVRIIRLSCDYRVGQWLKLAFISILSTPLHDLSVLEMDCIGAKLLFHMIITQSKAGELRLRTVTHEEIFCTHKLLDPAFAPHSQCALSALDVWENQTRRLILNDDYHTTQEIVSCTTKGLAEARVCQECVDGITTFLLSQTTTTTMKARVSALDSCMATTSCLSSFTARYPWIPFIYTT